MKSIFCLALVFLGIACAHENPIPVEQRGRSVESVKQLLNGKMPVIMECFEKARSNKKTIVGRLVVMITVERSGRVSEVVAKENTTNSKEIESCVIETYKKLDFDSGYTVTKIDWPLLFKENKN